MQGKLSIATVLDFWYSKPMSQHWFASTPEIDQNIKDQFESIWFAAKAGELDHWKETADGCLALCIILDQMPLNMFRGEAKSFSTEQQAVAISKYAIENALDTEIPAERIAFLYMPLMHSESLDDQNRAVESFKKVELEGNLRFAQHHQGIIERFGRFPHRNQILGRQSTPEELEYLTSDKAFTG